MTEKVKCTVPRFTKPSDKRVLKFRGTPSSLIDSGEVKPPLRRKQIL